MAAVSRNVSEAVNKTVELIAWPAIGLNKKSVMIQNFRSHQKCIFERT